MKIAKRKMMGWLTGALLFWMAAVPMAQAFYNPTTGRWLSRDPIEEVGFTVLTNGKDATENTQAEEENPADQPDDLNLYRFVSNDPLSAYDAFGLWELRCRPLAGIAKATRQKHCWIECGGRSYSLLNDDGIANRHIDDPRDKGKGSVVASGSGDCGCIQRQFKENKRPYVYDKDQCNSNYYAHQLLGCCGITIPRPSGGYGWDDCDDKSKAFKCVPCTN